MSDALYISPDLSIPMAEIELSAIRASGPGGQHVNKTSSAIQLRFYIPSSSLSESQKSRLFAFSDSHISENGMVVIKAQSQRSQHRNRQEALDRFKGVLKRAFKPKVKRKRTRPSYGAIRRGVKANKINSEKKIFRGKIDPNDF